MKEYRERGAKDKNIQFGKKNEDGENDGAYEEHHEKRFF
jgi:hypothetical protein